MIGTVHLNVLRTFYFAMLGFVWMLVDTVYHIIRPLEIPNENDSDKSTEKCDLKNSLVEKSNQLDVQESQGKSQNESDSELSLRCETFREEEKRKVNPDVNYLSKQKLTFTSQDALLERRLVLKRPHENMCSVSSESLAKNYEKSFNLIVVKNAFNKKCELKNNLVFSIREITKFMNKCIPADRRENILVPAAQFPGANNRKDIILKLSTQNLENGLETKRKKSNWFSVQPSEPTTHGKRIKLDNVQILALQETAHYIINHLDIEVKSQFKKKFEDMEISDYFDINEDYLGLGRKQTTKDREPNVTITELDSADEIELTKKHKNQRKKKNKKKPRRAKLNNQNTETNPVTFSSKQCFERLAFFMSTNQRLTQSKMMFEIEKEFKPIKDQISELRESMTDYVVVNHKTNENGVKSCRLSVKPVDGSGHKLRSIFTVPSASLQRLALLADTSNCFQENCNPEIIDSVPKKLSPLADMYIKLSRQKI